MSQQNPFQIDRSAGAEEMADFSSPTPNAPIPFKIDGDVFYARPRIAGGVVLGLAQVASVEEIEEQITLIRTFLRKVLLPNSLVMFLARLDSEPYVDPDTQQKIEDPEPIELTQVLDVFKFLVRRYTNGMGDETPAVGGFPTPGLSPSLGGSGITGPSLPEPALSTAVSIPGTPR